MQTTIIPIKLNTYLNCYKKYAVKNFYVKNMSEQTNYYLTIGGDRFGPNIVGTSSTMVFDNTLNMFTPLKI